MRASSILKLSIVGTIVWASVKWPGSKWVWGEGCYNGLHKDHLTHAWKPNGLGPSKRELEFSTFLRNFLKVHILWSWPRNCQEWWRACRSRFIWDTSRHHLRIVSLVKILSWKLKCKVDLHEEACIWGCTAMRISFLQELNISSVKGALGVCALICGHPS